MGVSDFAKGAADKAVAKVSDKLRSSDTARSVAGAEDWLTEQRMTRKLGKGTFRGTTLKVHRGYCYGDTMKVLARVAESARVPEETSLPYWDVVKANVRRHWSLSLPGVQVVAEFAGHSVEAVTDRHGFAPLTLHVPNLSPGWHTVTVRTVPHRDDIIEEIVSQGRVFKPQRNAPFAVISDIDDTVIRSGLAEGFSSVRRTLLGDQHSRTAIPGVASWYRGLARTGSVNGVEPGFFYVSTGSWSFYEMLVQFLQIRGFPRGPLFLTDWGPTDRYLHRSGAMHKKHTIGLLLQAYPDLPFVFVGDTGQGDFEAYTNAAARFGDQVRLIVLLPAGDGDRTEELSREAELQREAGIPVYVVADAVEAAELARDAGLCDDLTIDEVLTEIGAVF